MSTTYYDEEAQEIARLRRELNEAVGLLKEMMDWGPVSEHECESKVCRIQRSRAFLAKHEKGKG